MRLHAQHMTTILSSMVNIIEKGEEVYDLFMSTMIFTLIVNKIFKRVPNIMRKATTALICYASCLTRHCHHPL